MGLQDDPHILSLKEGANLGDRAGIAGSLAETFNAGELAGNERSLAISIFRILAEDVEVFVRKTLSEALKSSDAIPHDLALHMATDVADVAVPVLEYSSLLDEKDLVGILNASCRRMQVAVASRVKVPETVSEKLVEVGDLSVVDVLTKNAGAKINKATYSEILVKHGESKAIGENLVDRRALPQEIAERLISFVSHEAKMRLISRHDVSSELVESVALSSRESSVTQLLLSGEYAARDTEALVTQMHAGGRLTTTLIIRALEVEDLDFFEHGIAKRAGIPIENARLLLKDSGGNGLIALYSQAAFPMEEFDWVSGRVSLLYSKKGEQKVYIQGGSQMESDDSLVSSGSWLDFT